MPAGAGQRREMPADRDNDGVLLELRAEGDHVAGVAAATVSGW